VSRQVGGPVSEICLPAFRCGIDVQFICSPFFGEEFQFDVPRPFRYLSVYVYDRDRHLKQDKVLGKVAIKREDLHTYHNKDHWFPILPVDADSEVQVIYRTPVCRCHLA
jgi:hypothetical protein